MAATTVSRRVVDIDICPNEMSIFHIPRHASSARGEGTYRTRFFASAMLNVCTGVFLMLRSLIVESVRECAAMNLYAKLAGCVQDT